MLDELLKPDEELRRKNYSLFKEKYGIELHVSKDENLRYRMEQSDSGELVAFRLIDESKVIRLNSLYSPIYEAVRWSEGLDFNNRRTTVCMYGFSTGVFIDSLRKRLRSDTQYYIYEPDRDFFSFICGYVDLTDVINDSNIFIYVDDEQKKHFYGDVSKDLLQFNSELQVLVTPQYLSGRDFAEICDSLIRDRNMKKYYVKSAARQALKARLYAWNHMRRGYLFPDLAKRIPEGIPAVIVSAGPSLEKNVDLLNSIKGHALIVCTDRAVSTLDSHSIEPDLIVSVDATKSADFLKYDIAKNVPLLASYQVNPDIQKLFEDNIIYFQGLVYEYGLIGEHSGATVSGLDFGGNVAGAAFCACRDLGIKTIVLIGQDLAYTDGKHHADSIKSNEMDMDVLTVEGVNGSPVTTNSMWISFKDFFEEEIRKHPDLKVIDATEGGALIRGTEIPKLSEVADEFRKNSYSLNIELTKMPRAQKLQDYTKTRNILEVWLKELDIFKENSKEIAVTCERLIELCEKTDLDDRSVQDLLGYLEKLREEITSSIVNFMMEEYWIKDISRIPDEKILFQNNKEAIELFENLKIYYTDFQEYSDSLQKEISKAIDKGIEDNGKISDLD